MRCSDALNAGRCEMVAREGVAPPTSLCKRDMILFHHRAEKLAAGDGLAPPTSLSKSDEFLLLHPAVEIGGAGGSCNLTISD